MWSLPLCPFGPAEGADRDVAARLAAQGWVEGTEEKEQAQRRTGKGENTKRIRKLEKEDSEFWAAPCPSFC